LSPGHAQEAAKRPPGQTRHDPVLLRHDQLPRMAALCVGDALDPTKPGLVTTIARVCFKLF
jgi:hypothetical protein